MSESVYAKVFRDQRNHNADLAAEMQARLEVENVQLARALSALEATANVINTLGLTQKQLEQLAKNHVVLERGIVLDPKAGPDDPTSPELLAQRLKTPTNPAAPA